jgi:hypothetical protein
MQIRGGRKQNLSEMIPVEPDPDNAGGGRIEKKLNPFFRTRRKGFYLTKGIANHGNNGGGDF